MTNLLLMGYKAGFNAVELRSAGFDVADLKVASFSCEEIRNAGFSLSRLVICTTYPTCALFVKLFIPD